MRKSNPNVTSRGPHLINDSFLYHVSDTTINMYLRDIGHRLPLQEIGICLRSLETYALQQMTIHGDIQAAERRYRHGKVAMSFMPLRMKWGVAVLVMKNLEIIFMNHDWTYASHITIEDQYEGTIGYVSIAYRVQGEPSQSSAYGNPQPPVSINSNNSLPLGLQRNDTLTERPESPHIQIIPKSHISLTYAAYGNNLNSLSVFTILTGAKLYVEDRIKHLGPLGLVNELHPWKVSDAELTINPSDRLRWFDLLTVLDGLMEFVDKFDTFAFAFQIRYQGGRLLGFGQLRPGTEKDSTL